eukprot:superscaffoldBa00003616_g17327
MFKLVLLFLTLSGLQAAPIAAPRGLQKASSYQLPDGFRQGTEHFDILEAVPDSFRQGTEPSRRFLVDLNTGLVQEHINEMDRRAGFIQPSLGNGFGEMDRRQWLKDEDGFKQGTEPFRFIPDGFRQGTEPFRSIPDGFRQGTKPFRSIPDGFRQGTEPIRSIPDGFRQGTEPFMSIPHGFRQGTEPFRSTRDGFRQGTELSTSKLQTKTVACKGEVINGNCFEFNPMPLAFQEAQNQQASWVDGSEWSYSNWMPGHPNIHTDKPVCVEMFKIDESWWTAADCELKRASICSYGGELGDDDDGGMWDERGGEGLGFGGWDGCQFWSCWVLYTVSPEEIWVSLLLEPHSFRVIWPERI